MKSITIFPKALFGKIVPKNYVERSDSYYYKPTQEIFDEAHEFVRKDMSVSGWALNDYNKRAQDCEDFAMKMSVEIRQYIASNYPVKVGVKGVAVGIVGYSRDKDGAGHVIVKAQLKNGTKYYEPYPEDRHSFEKKMSDRELDSIDLDFM